MASRRVAIRARPPPSSRFPTGLASCRFSAPGDSPPAIRRRMTSSCPSENGLVRYSYAPSRTAAIAESSDAYAVTMMTEDEGFAHLAARSTARPSTPGNCRVAEAPTGAEAMERLKGFAYDALVIDLRLPDADGMEVLDAAVARYPEVLAVMMTGFGGVTEAVRRCKRGRSTS
jgi:CheY-like chemotaxis protein